MPKFRIAFLALISWSSPSFGQLCYEGDVQHSISIDEWSDDQSVTLEFVYPGSTILIQNDFGPAQIWFDTCVYHQPGIDLLLKVVPADKLLFGSEMVGAVRGIDPDSGNHYDDTKIYVDHASVSDLDRSKIYEANIRQVYPRLGGAS